MEGLWNFVRSRDNEIHAERAGRVRCRRRIEALLIYSAQGKRPHRHPKSRFSRRPEWPPSPSYQFVIRVAISIHGEMNHGRTEESKFFVGEPGTSGTNTAVAGT